MLLTRNPGLLALSVWLILVGLLPLLNLSFPASGILLALLAIAASVLLLAGQVRQTRKLGVACARDLAHRHGCAVPVGDQLPGRRR